MGPLTDEQKRLAEKAVERAKRIADRYARIFPEHADEFESSAAWGIIRAAESFSREREDAVWERWSDLHVKSEITNYVRKERRRSSLVGHERFEEHILDCCESEAKRCDTLEWAMSVLDGDYREVVKLVYEHGMTAEQAGIACGYTGRYGRHLHRKAIKQLRKLIA